MQDLREYAYIVEFSYNTKSEHFVVRFLDNNSYVLNISELPKKIQTRKPDWESATLSSDRSALIIKAGKELRQIPYHVIHSRGTIL